MKTLLKETDLCLLAKEAIADFCEVAPQWRDEMLCQTAEGLVPCDSGFFCDMCYGVLEGKAVLNRELEQQLVRWFGMVHYLWTVFTVPAIVKEPWRNRKARLLARGVGIVQIIGGVAKIAQGEHARFQEADTRVFEAAFLAHDGSQAPAAGVASAQRITGERAILCNIADMLTPGVRVNMKFIRAIPLFRTITEHKLCKMIDAERGWAKLPLDYDRKKSPTEFWVKETQ